MFTAAAAAHSSVSCASLAGLSPLDVTEPCKLTNRSLSLLGSLATRTLFSDNHMLAIVLCVHLVWTCDPTIAVF